MTENEKCKHGHTLSQRGTTAGREQEGFTWCRLYEPCKKCLEEAGVCVDCMGVGEYAEEVSKDEFGDSVIDHWQCSACGGTGRIIL